MNKKEADEWCMVVVSFWMFCTFCIGIATAMTLVLLPTQYSLIRVFSWLFFGVFLFIGSVFIFRHLKREGYVLGAVEIKQEKK